MDSDPETLIPQVVISDMTTECPQKSFKASNTLSEGLSEYLRRYDLGDGGYTARWFKIKFFWKFVLTLPNIENRRRAVKFHDLHHVLTEYPTGLRGEAEIGAWEVASGCGKYWAAWVLNAGSIFYGIFLYPISTYRAFVRGRHSKNLYSHFEYDVQLLSQPIDAIRDKLNIPFDKVRTRAQDLALFILTAFVLLLIYIGLPLFLIKQIIL